MHHFLIIRRYDNLLQLATLADSLFFIARSFGRHALLDNMNDVNRNGLGLNFYGKLSSDAWIRRISELVEL